MNPSPRHSTKKLDLTGQRFGQLTVLAPAENIGSRTAWHCRCDCGQDIVVTTSDLRRGRRRYLGSYHNFEDAVKARKRAEEELFKPFLDVCAGKLPESELPDIEEVCPPVPRDYSGRRLDLTGQRFGQLTVVAPAEKIGSMTAWRCRCDCGKECVVMTGHLRDGHTTSCGCKPSVTLIDGTCVELIQAKTIRRNNTSGVTGVEWVPRRNMWRAVIFFKGKRHFLGNYGKFEDAVKARKRGEEEYFEKFLAACSELSETQGELGSGHE